MLFRGFMAELRGARIMEIWTTERLTAQRLGHADLDDLVALHLDPDVSRYLGGVRLPAVTTAYLETNMAHWDRYGFGLWTWRTLDGEFVGRAGMRHVVVEDAQEVEIAYALKRAFWGMGMASEITKALLEVGFQRLGLSSLVGVVFVSHVASRHVLEKAGFLLERDVVFHDQPCVLYRKLSPEAPSGVTP
jgi:RimJ/RimL family protein N-acetyltransferase